MAELDNLLGSQISLISSQDVRYEGILFSINQSESSIVLQNVLCFGTEDRPAEKFVPVSDNVLAFVSFPGNEIKDLYVHEPGQQEENSAANLPTPPPQKDTSAPPAPPASNETKSKIDNQRSNQRNSESGRGGDRQRRHGGGRGNAGGGRGPAPAAGTGEHLLKLRERTGANGSAAPVKPQGDFDFNAGLTSFKKEEVLAEVAEEASKSGSTVGGSYNKDNFFDTLSCSALDGDRRKDRLTPGEERSLNQDTFGAIALQRHNYRRGGRGGRGRGYHGRGGGRGGWGNNRQNQGGRRGGRGGYNKYPQQKATEKS
mmetsp:Transcript_9072/g.13643  ORF Transcript_9072/g.13643 Transcript_9072/m.13643 type:complete len:314 (+) Transcript_9072:80-1021(+)|eukprot:CAMPEP_0185025002 /NCGR_PEP_ID=MMETSP1103-20130426/8133_1 /TAXON_ID=36769 /ORGANISM="Paraphysomonas bandaiensis, Strain Caron Lab Isolate" /LENGTH=313 /DNA_ID=CAMNT_0027558109 /DNA_START=31 /DNA_END=972 /DNA_ORIENTATION=-